MEVRTTLLQERKPQIHDSNQLEAKPKGERAVRHAHLGELVGSPAGDLGDA